MLEVSGDDGSAGLSALSDRGEKDGMTEPTEVRRNKRRLAGGEEGDVCFYLVRGETGASSGERRPALGLPGGTQSPRPQALTRPETDRSEQVSGRQDTHGQPVRLPSLSGACNCSPCLFGDRVVSCANRCRSWQQCRALSSSATCSFASPSSS